MTPIHDNETNRPCIDPDNPQHLLILAYSRLFLLPERDDGSKLTVVAAFGHFEVRLFEFQGPSHPSLASLWVELYNRGANQVLDSAGCKDLAEAGAAAEALIAEARRLNRLQPS